MAENNLHNNKKYKAENFDNFDVSKVTLLIVVVGAFMMSLLLFLPALFVNIVNTLIVLSPIWLPLLLAYIFWKFWVLYIRSLFIRNEKYILLEIKPPREVTKSPLAMESVLSGFHQTIGERTLIDKYWFGKVRPWYSLEIVSIEGQVKFFIWSRAFLRNIVEARIYAEYPGVEISEAPDYARALIYNPAEVSIWGADFVISEPDAYPIKTYVDYGMEKDPKEEHKIDPITPMLELFGSIGKGEQLWMQIMIRANREERTKKGTLFGKTGWKNEAQGLVDELMKRDPKTKASGQISEKSGFPIPIILSQGEKDIITAIERSITKLGFDVGMRGLYVAKKDKFNPQNIVGLIGTVKQFNSNTLNKFGTERWHSTLKYPWEEYKGILRGRISRRVFDAYRRRSFFHPPYTTNYFVLNTEELATIFHFPGEVAHTPTISRISSKKSEAPSDLPI
jgi:hypothetical protein